MKKSKYIVIADSGSTKTDWLLVENKQIIKQKRSKGLNPVFLSEEEIYQVIDKESIFKEELAEIQSIHFFGAGCSSKPNIDKMHKSLKKFFTNSTILVEHDMTAAALACCEGEAGIACILGTGSNICYFDGKKMHTTKHGIGYILGDEASGSYFGKKLIAYYLYGIMPGDLQRRFKSYCRLQREDLIHRVYHEKGANIFLADFARFMTKNKNHGFIKNLISKGINDFFDTHIETFEQCREVPVHFAGSIAHHFSETIHLCAIERNIVIGNIIQRPAEKLAEVISTNITIHKKKRRKKTKASQMEAPKR